MKAHSPLLGFNNNVRHKGRVFHIQTEDSGVRHPHIITHLFADGGRILKTTKTSYAEHVGENGISETVRAMMKEQHKGMFIALRDGQLDHLVADLPLAERAQPQAAAPAAAAAPPEPVAASAPAAAAPREIVVPNPAERPAIDAVASAARSAPPRDGAVVVVDRDPAYAATPMFASATTEAPASRAVVEHETGPRSGPVEEPGDSAREARSHESTEPPPPPKRTTSRPRLEINTAGIHRATSPLAPTVEMQSIVDEPSIDLDLDALERAAVEAQNPVVMRQHELPPPPAAVLGKKQATRPIGGYSVTTSTTPTQGTPRQGQGVLPPGAGRYAPSRPAAIFANSRPQDGASIFGEDLISEKSLDEVILSYLAEDLDGPGDKK